MNQQRSNGSSRIRAAGPLIFNCTPQFFNNNESRTETYKVLIGFAMNGNSVGHYTTLAPILYKEDAQTNSKWTIFRNPIIMKVRSPVKYFE